jgi:hypothetical protein
MQRYLPFILFHITVILTNGQPFTGANSIQIKILTDQKEYEFISQKLEVRLNDVMGRFEFKIPVSSFKSMKDSSDIKFLQAFANSTDEITMNAALPEEKDAQLDLSYFKGNKSINLEGQIKVGNNTFEDVIEFNGMLMDRDHRMAFNMSMFLSEKELSSFVKKERILQLKIGAKGDKIIELTTN